MKRLTMPRLLISVLFVIACEFPTFALAANLTFLEIQQLSDALHSYRDRFGEFPPSPVLHDDGSERQLRRHLAKAFPLYRYNSGPETTPNLSELDAAEALVFFLGGVRCDSDTHKLCGFSQDARDPFRSRDLNEPSARIGPFYEFDPKRLVDQDNDGFYEYLPPDSTVPYVYFRADNYGNVCDLQQKAFGLAVAYRRSPSEWQLPDTFQIISAGPDGNFGSSQVREFPSMDGFTAADLDNETNFAHRPLYDAVVEQHLDSDATRLLLSLLVGASISLPTLFILRWRAGQRVFVSLLLLNLLIVAISVALAAKDTVLGFSGALHWAWTGIGGFSLACAWWTATLSAAFVHFHGCADRRSWGWANRVFAVAMLLPFLLAWVPESATNAYLSDHPQYAFGLPFSFYDTGRWRDHFSALALTADLAIGVVVTLGLWRLVRYRSSVGASGVLN